MTSRSDDIDVDDNFPGETLMEINTKNETMSLNGAEAQALPTNDARVVITYFSKATDSAILECPKALIKDRGSHSANEIKEKRR
ncbi:hypothetical protein Tco_0570867 [Tanacetum coccineum]